MLFYRVYSESTPTDTFSWAADFSTAKKYASIHKNYPDIYVDLVDVPTDKKAMLQLLNTGNRSTEYAVKRSWELSPRGGLLEVPVPEKVDDVD